MGNSLARGGRRRRVLNEEIVAASGTHQIMRKSNSSSEQLTTGLVYSEAAHVDNHPRLSDLIPRRCRSILLATLLGCSAVGLLLTLDHFEPELAELAGLTTIAAADITAPGNLAAWFSSVTLLVASALGLLIYSLRRHKLDDYRGRYRLWPIASAVLLLLSVNSVAAVHRTWSAAMAHLTGWTMWPGDAIWWIVPSAVVLGWIAMRVLVDVWESRLARATMLLALTVYLTTLLVHLGALAAIAGTAAESYRHVVFAGGMLAGHVLLVTAVTAYARFVVLAAQGFLQPRKKSASQAKSVPAAKNSTPAPAAPPRRAQTTDAASSNDSTSRRRRPAEVARSRSSETEWIDGSQPVDDNYGDLDDTPRRKLSKAERKRLRKQNAARRAA